MKNQPSLDIFPRLMMNFEPGQVRAPAVFGDFWFNSEPISIQDLRGGVVLLDFWDFASVGCRRALPYVIEWQNRYRDFGLTVIGIHTPEFNFGKNPGLVEKEIRALGVNYPVVADNEARVWSLLGNRIWPTKYLVDKDGFLRFRHHGEGGYDQFERAIQALLTETGFRGEMPDLMQPLRQTDEPGIVCYRSTAEIRLGWLRGAIGNPEGLSPESTIAYEDLGVYLSGRCYLKGRWHSDKECIRFDGEADEKGEVLVRYEAVEVNVVMDVGGGECGRVYVYQDGRPLTVEISGSDVQFDKSGVSFVQVEVPRIFNIVRNREFGDHLLKLSTSSRVVGFYVFSFVSGAIPDLISNN